MPEVGISIPGDEGETSGKGDNGFRGEAGDAVDETIKTLEENTLKEIRLKELNEWKEGDFKESVRAIVEAQQEICGEEGNQEACSTGQEVFQKMFGEPYNQEEQVPAN